MYNTKKESSSYNIRYILNKSWDIFLKYYFIIIGLYFLKKALYLCKFPSISTTSKIYLFVLSFIAFSAYNDMRNDVKILPFLVLCIPFLTFVVFLNKYGYTIWGKMLNWQISRKIVVDLNPLFSSIPLNDGKFARMYTNQTLTWFFRMIYNNGFVLPVLLVIYRSAIMRDFKKMLRYALSAHIIQVLLITPFYLTFHLQEVWYVYGDPDRLARHLSPLAAAGVTLNCFPSMHTSISFAMFLLVLRERDKFFKIFMSFFCLSVVFSTLYLEVHWVLDVLAGMLLAFITVKIVDFMFKKLQPLLQSFLDKYYYKKINTTYIENYYIDTLGKK